MKETYSLGLDVAKQKVRAALWGAAEERFLFEKDLPVRAAGERALLARLEEHVPEKACANALNVSVINWP